MRKTARCSISVPLLFFTLALMGLFLPQISMANETSQTHETKENWLGVDETVVAKYATAYGREPVEPLINTDQGDLLLFVFLLGGVLGGFTCGYYWRVLIEGGKSSTCTKTNTGHIKKTCAVRADTSNHI